MASMDLDDLLQLHDGGPSGERKSAYQKVGTGVNTSSKAIAAVTEEMGDGVLKERFGFIPKSILRFDRNKEMMAFLEDTSKVRGQLRSAIGGGYASHLRYGMYNLDAAKFFLDYYMPPRAHVLDPFMGRASRSLAAYLLDMTYVGFDTCADTVALNREKVLDRSGWSDLPTGWGLHHGDGTELAPYANEANVFDGVFTCPPYYDTEVYSGSSGDLSHMKVAEFDARIDTLFTHLHRLVKPSTRTRPDIHPVVVTVGTYRDTSGDGLLDMDFSFQRSAFKAGFRLHDKVVTENIPPGAGFTFRRNFGSGYVCKAHETTLVFVKKA